MTATLSWPEVLDRIRGALEHALAETGRREQSLAAADAALPAAPDLAALTSFAARVQALDRSATGASTRVAALDAEFASAEQRLRAWLQATEAARAKLAGWVGRAVG
jgi:hypothetical protein